jgi:hypothetical protein
MRSYPHFFDIARLLTFRLCTGLTEEAAIEIEQQQVPEAVFGGLTSMIEASTESSAAIATTSNNTNTNVNKDISSNVSQNEDSEPKVLGAKERLRRKRGI